MESKDDARDRGGDLPLFAEVARFFQDQAFMCAKDEGLEVVFDDFVNEHAAAFANDAETREEGHSFEFTELHGEYLRLFEKATERVLEVAGGTREQFAAECRAALRGGARPDGERWFLDACLAALDYEAFYETMARCGRKRRKSPAESKAGLSIARRPPASRPKGRRVDGVKRPEELQRDTLAFLVVCF